MKNKSLGFGLGISMLLAVVFNFISDDAFATDPIKIPCYATSTVHQGYTHIKCSTCADVTGLGSDLGQCGPSDD